MAEVVTLNADAQTLIGPGWELRADRLDGSAAEWSALIGIRRGLKILVTRENAEWLMVEAWTGEPGDSDAAAVIDVGEGAPRVAAIPLASCGLRECGNAGLQFGKLLAARDLPALIGLLRELPWTGIIPTRSNVLRGTELIALEPPDLDAHRADRWYSAGQQSGPRAG